ncbi:MAG: hypothetical protein A3I38_02435 [Candidatus Wildermuthbacteria bacterium RIFCSPLOWO2_02_FULL_47_10]|uniref:Uncharacterized protein n=1 Tax=Candidatus Wildermuthbacteria bacterium RIFCSPHIGHO2_02_FULL_47_17 TaxID=1802452 RepID=A0A1G2R278_9BACT|nr:MAG: hypothetical protein A3D59_00070 [Candidatus Wildermuthbacteria bacterium RIFCSPHIGHO2_02_FULL_47_17]OHA75190.1 MAG: hypothetical protein A3I38_02435 [Candidatus Wildermuthbacteria bacterium RIFCSPLOWO2_02_FULL_47_10]
MKKKHIFILASLVLVSVVAVSYYYSAFFKVGGLPGAANVPSDCSQLSIDVYQKAIAEIDSNKGQYSEKSHDLMELTTEGGHQADYRDQKGEIRLIQQTLYGETFRSEIKYYFAGINIFFTTVSRFEYDRPIYVEPEAGRKIIKVIVRDFYLNKSQEVCSWYLDKSSQQNDAKTQEFIKYLISTLPN